MDDDHLYYGNYDQQCSGIHISMFIQFMVLGTKKLFDVLKFPSYWKKGNPSEFVKNNFIFLSFCFKFILPVWVIKHMLTFVPVGASFSIWPWYHNFQSLLTQYVQNECDTSSMKWERFVCLFTLCGSKGC